jgi:hypothetical protein
MTERGDRYLPTYLPTVPSLCMSNRYLVPTERLVSSVRYLSLGYFVANSYSI